MFFESKHKRLKSFVIIHNMVISIFSRYVIIMTVWYVDLATLTFNLLTSKLQLSC